MFLSLFICVQMNSTAYYMGMGNHYHIEMSSVVYFMDGMSNHYHISIDDLCSVLNG